MILQVYSVLDKAVGSFLPPFFARSKGEALRSFSEACLNPESNFSKYQNDFTLYHLGTYDDGGAVFQCFDPVRVIGAWEIAPPVDVRPVAERQAQDRATFGS